MPRMNFFGATSLKPTILPLFAVVFLFFMVGSVHAATSSADAIAVRVLPNVNHYSAIRWYRVQNFKGSPQSLIVDGYEAVRDGRTVYANVANVVDGNNDGQPDTLHTNIFIISYNQQAEVATVDIFGQLLAHWKFNSNITTAGSCSQSSGKGCSRDADCSSDETCSDNACVVKCLTDSECTNAGYCDSYKAKITRETKRLADLAEIKIALEKFKSSKGGYPKVAAGSYLANKTLSTWPSWQVTLGRELGVTLPSEPINRLGRCRASDAENKDYDPATCWSQKDKKFATVLPQFPANSHLYYYSVAADGFSYGLCSIMESGLITAAAEGACNGSEVTTGVADNHPPAISCGSLAGMPHDKFEGYVSAVDPDGDTLSWSLDTSGTAWTGWSSAPVKKDSALSGSFKQIYADSAGVNGNYNFKVTVTDSRGASSVKECAAVIGVGLPTILPIADKTVYVGHDLDGFVIYSGEATKQYPLTFDFKGIHTISGTVIDDFLSCEYLSPNQGESNGSFICKTAKKKIEYQAGVWTVSVAVTDSSGDVAAATFKLTVVNDPPALTSHNAAFVASSTNPISMIWLEAQDDPTNMPAGFSFITGSLPLGVAGNSSVQGGLSKYVIVGSLSPLNVFNLLDNMYNFIIRVTDKYGASSEANLTINVKNNPPQIQPFTCQSEAKVKNQINACNFTASDPENNGIKSFNSPNLPSGLVINTVGKIGSITGTPSLSAAGSHAIQITATDEFGFTSAASVYNLKLKTYCGDGAVEKPNMEAIGGPANDGNEGCDGSDGIATTPAESSPTKQYACSSDCKPIGGYIGDGVISGGEECDSSDFGGKTCVNFGFDGGSLSCTAVGTINTSGCAYFVCGDGSCNGTDSTVYCPQDCGSSCGDGACNGSETTSNCTFDCAVCGDGILGGSEQCDFGAKNGTGIGCAAGCMPEGGFSCSSNICCVKSHTVAAKGWTWSDTGKPASGVTVKFYSDPSPYTATCTNGTVNACPSFCSYNAAARGAGLVGSCVTDGKGDCTLASPLPSGIYIQTSDNSCSLVRTIVPFNVCYYSNGTSYVY